MTTLDHLTDPLRVQFIKLAQQYEVPDYVGEATEEQLQAPEGDHHRLYALPMKKALPLHTKVATWLSAAYLEESTGYSDYERKIAKRSLQQAAAVHGVEWPKKKAQVVEPAPTADDYLIEIDTGNGILRRLPVRNDAEVKVASAYLKEHRLEFPWSIRQQASQRLLTKAAALGSQLSEQDANLFNIDAANFVAEPDQLSELLKTRSLIAQHLGLTKQAEQLKSLSAEVAAPNGLVIDGDLAGDILAAVEVFDNSIGRKAAAVDTFPVVTTDQFTKWAADACVLKSGHVYNRNQFAKLPVNEAAIAAGVSLEDITDETGVWIDTAKTAAVLENLSEHAANRIAKLCDMQGIKCEAYIEKEARLTQDEMRILASV
jgi:hypothetical protein